MKILFKSKLYEDQIFRLLTYFSLLVWALISTVYAIQNRKEVVLIAIDHTGYVRTITDKNDKFLQEEIKGFLQSFLNDYYTYDQLSFDAKLGKASELLSISLWNEQKEKLLSISEKLKKEPLSQISDLESLDMLGDNKFEAILKVKVTQRLQTHDFKIKVNLSLKDKPRSDSNPYKYEITELNDVVL